MPGIAKQTILVAAAGKNHPGSVFFGIIVEVIALFHKGSNPFLYFIKKHSAYDFVQNSAQTLEITSTPHGTQGQFSEGGDIFCPVLTQRRILGSFILAIDHRI